MMDQHHQPCAAIRLRPFQHLLITGRIAERCDRPPADEEMNAFRFTGFVVDQEYLRQLDQSWFPIRTVFVFDLASGADDLLRRHAVNRFGERCERTPDRRR